MKMVIQDGVLHKKQKKHQLLFRLNMSLSSWMTIRKLVRGSTIQDKNVQQN